MENDKIYVYVFFVGLGGGDEGGGGREGCWLEVVFFFLEVNIKIIESRLRGCCSCYYCLIKMILVIVIIVNVGDIVYVIVMVYNFVKFYRL